MIRILKATRPPRVPKADARERSLGLVFRQAIRAAAEKTSEAELVRALEENNVDGAVAVVRWDVVQEMLAQALPKRYRLIYEEGYDKARRMTKRALRKDEAGVGYGFDYTDPASVAWAKSRSAALITEWGAMSREALRALITKAFQEGIPPRELARIIRDSGIGLTTRQAEAVVRRRVQLIRDGIRPDRVESMTERYAAQLLRQRAEVIARTEIIEAHIKGTQAGFERDLAEGILDDGSRQVWITDPDERTCELCEALDRAKAKIGEEFEPGIYGPPRHPQCRCGLIIEP